jgi:exonuclease VII small subunit
VDEGAEDIAGAYHDALDRAEEVEAIIEQEKADLDAAIEEAEGGTTDD